MNHIINNLNHGITKGSRQARFGKEIFHYKLIEYLNQREMIAKDPRLWSDVRRKYRQFYYEISKDFESMFKNSDHSYETIVGQFMHNDEAALERLDGIITDLIRVDDKKLPYNLQKDFITWDNPSPKKPRHNGAFNLGEVIPHHDLDYLPYQISSPIVVNTMINRYHSRPTTAKMSFDLYDSLQASQTYQGEVLYKIMMEKLLRLNPDFDNRRTREKFLINNNKLKTIISIESGFLTRNRSVKYLNVLPRVKINETVLIDKFHQFLILIYYQHRSTLYDKFTQLLRLYNDKDYDAVYYKDAMKSFDTFVKFPTKL